MKVEASGYAEGLMGIPLVPASDLDRANAEIERLERQRNALADAVYRRMLAQKYSHAEAAAHMKSCWQVFIAADGTVTEIDHG